ncbi:STAS domain-containing protein [Syntrophus aciditrophicus]|jgi:anti-sigma B factor antagonist|uniref:Anti-sigma factor antagonist n=1 Tax=Syntrophus aciditrophicus (strain SB) TaxID=56780 RepID=Q2LXZ7_SYNAS|nr:STAS domain-containing protein [Syntrophus aciditrophicus]ABC78954.1 anti-sigma B factor antagonist [Syntrophus aciditrophicus SB]OPY19239.1 MAG: Anti-sigma-B factor antagonist [Syntrophus sp. PtaB.Bin075]
MQLHQTKNGDVLIVKPLEKRIDAATATEFKEKMSNWIGAGNKRIVLNLTEVDFIDSSGLGAIVSSLKKIGTEGDLVICAVKETVMSLFRLTRMNRVFDIFPSEDEAVRSLSGKA